VSLWGQVPSLHRSQISENFDLKEHLIDSGSGSRIRPRDGGAEFCSFFGKGISSGVFPFLLFRNLLLNGREAAV
jgi:hypothetical protein